MPALHVAAAARRHHSQAPGLQRAPAVPTPPLCHRAHSLRGRLHLNHDRPVQLRHGGAQGTAGCAGLTHLWHAVAEVQSWAWLTGWPANSMTLCPALCSAGGSAGGVSSAGRAPAPDWRSPSRRSQQRAATVGPRNWSTEHVNILLELPHCSLFESSTNSSLQASLACQSGHRCPSSTRMPLHFCVLENYLALESLHCKGLRSLI